MKIPILLLAAFALLLQPTHSIVVPLEMNIPRCFVLDYFFNQTFKVQLQLPELQAVSIDEGYFVTWKNIRTHDTEQVHIGVMDRFWAREMDFQEQAFYEFCIRADGLVPNPKTLHVHVEFTKQWHHKKPRRHVVNISGVATTQKVTNATDAAFELNMFTDDIEAFQKKRFEKQQMAFYNIHEALKWIEYYALGELLLLGVFAVLQLFCMFKITAGFQ